VKIIQIRHFLRGRAPPVVLTAGALLASLGLAPA